MKSSYFAAVLAAGAALAAVPAAAQPKPPQAFLSDAIKGDNSEMKLGALAHTKGSTAAVRDFGATLERDHGKAKTMAAATARSKRVAVPSAMKPEATEEYAKLSKLSGKAFDAEFKRTMIMDHEKDIAMFEEQTKSPDTATAQLAKQTLPDLRKHLEMARALS